MTNKKLRRIIRFSESFLTNSTLETSGNLQIMRGIIMSPAIKGIVIIVAGAIITGAWMFVGG